MTDKNTVFNQNNPSFEGNAASGDNDRRSPVGRGLVYQKKTINIGGNLIDLSVPKVMGILNLTPDSFYDGGKYNTAQNALTQTEKMLTEGADFIDIGAYSSRPRAEHITQEEELERLIPIIKLVKKQFNNAVISVDTFRAAVVKQAVAEGAQIINDTSAGEMDVNMFETVARLRVPYILMHMKGTPQTMQQNPQYTDVLIEVCDYFLPKIKRLTELGAIDLIIDPGFGFAKTMDHNYELFGKLEMLKILGVPIMVGVSRKSMVYKPLGTTAAEALNGTTVLNTVALMKGAGILRVHDVKQAVEAVKLVSQVIGF